jgi:hypothetical protein
VRNKIKVADSEYLFTVPIKKSANRNDLIIKDVLFVDDHFKEKFFLLIQRSYKKAKYYDCLIEFVRQIILFDTPRLPTYNINIIQKICQRLGITTSFLMASKIPEVNGKKGELIFNICKKMNATTYVSPFGSRNYLEEKKDQFIKNDIAIFYQKYQHPQYTQVGATFISHLAIIDLLLNEGIEHSKQLIIKGRQYEK